MWSFLLDWNSEASTEVLKTGEALKMPQDAAISFKSD